MTEEPGSGYEICLRRFLIGRFHSVRSSAGGFIGRTATPAELYDVSGFHPAPGFPERSVTWAERVQPPGLAPENRPGLRLRPGGMSPVFRPERALRRKSTAGEVLGGTIVRPVPSTAQVETEPPGAQGRLFALFTMLGNTRWSRRRLRISSNLDLRLRS